MPTTTMNRREAILRLAVLMGGTMVGPRLFSAALDSDAPGAGSGASAGELALLDEIGDTIIPATDVPGAKAVHIGAFIAMMVHDCYEPADQAAFQTGLGELAKSYRAKHGHEFVGAPATERTEFLNGLDREQKAYTKKKQATGPVHYFRMLKELTVLGYFSSEIGSTQALRFIEVPGKFDGSAPYKKGEHAWFS